MSLPGGILSSPMDLALIPWSQQAITLATPKALCKRGLRDTDDLGPIFRAHRHAIYRHVYVVASITKLLGHAGPSAIPRFVITVSVNTIKRLASRSLSHVFAERGERMAPAFTYSDAASSISRIGRISWILTAMTHRLPRIVSRILALSVGRQLPYQRFAPSTSATRRNRVRQIVGIHRFHGATVAPTQPISLVVPAAIIADDGPAPESPTSKVRRVTHVASIYQEEA